MTPEEIKEIQRQSFERLGKGLDHGVERRSRHDSESPWREWESASRHSNGSAYFYDGPNNEYRIRPETVNVFGHELPAPLTSLGERQKYWFVDCNETFFMSTLSSEAARLKNGQCFKSQEDAQAWADFFLKCRKGEFAQNPAQQREIDRDDLFMVINNCDEDNPGEITDAVIAYLNAKPVAPKEIDRDDLIEIIMRSWNTRADDMGSFWGGIADQIIEHLNAKPRENFGYDLSASESVTSEVTVRVEPAESNTIDLDKLFNDFESRGYPAGELLKIVINCLNQSAEPKEMSK